MNFIFPRQLNLSKNSFENRSMVDLYLKKRGPNPAVEGGVHIFINKNGMVGRTTMILCALDSPKHEQCFRYLLC